MVGTMIELPRACLVADSIAENAEFFSFGTNDLTQTTFGISRDDVKGFLPVYIDMDIYDADPFQRLDQEGVGDLMKLAVERGQKDEAGDKARHLRRTRRRAELRQVLPQDRAQLRVLFAVPRAHSTAGSRPGGA